MSAHSATFPTIEADHGVSAQVLTRTDKPYIDCAIQSLPVALRRTMEIKRKFLQFGVNPDDTSLFTAAHFTGNDDAMETSILVEFARYGVPAGKKSISSDRLLDMLTKERRVLSGHRLVIESLVEMPVVPVYGVFWDILYPGMKTRPVSLYLVVTMENGWPYFTQSSIKPEGSDVIFPVTAIPEAVSVSTAQGTVS